MFSTFKEDLMQSQEILNRYYQVRYNVFNWRYNANIFYKVFMVLCMACLTGLLAQFRFYLPWSPVPVTGQTFAVLMSGVLLGAFWGGLSQFIYVFLGLAGIPWFADGKAGLSILFGPTGGYLIGFVIASLIIGYIVDKNVKARNFLPMIFLMTIANFIIIYGFGLINLYLWLNIVKGTSVSLWKLLMMGAIPFIPGGILKIIVAAGLTKGIMPKDDFNK
jgi:biotin transport system substrate-specific component